MKNLLKKLVSCPSPSGFEFMIHRLISDEMSEKVDKIETDGIGNQYLWLKKYDENKKTLMISAHIDEIGLQLASEKDGVWRVSRLGGIDTKVLPGSLVRCYTDPEDKFHPWEFGVVSKKPIHLESQEERGTSEKLKDITIDFGGIEGLKPGMPVVPERTFVTLGEDLVSGPGLDDKAGVAVCLELINRLYTRKEFPVNIVVVLCAQEETGLRGAKIAAKRLNPDISIDLDVSFAGPRGDLPGEIEVGKGPIIAFGPDKNYGISHKLDSSEVPHQVEIAGAGGTNTSAIQLNAFDCKCALISIPEKNMHTPAEIVSLKDLEGCVKIILDYIQTL